MADSSEVDAAILKKLDDSLLRQLLPDGVYWDQAAPESKRFAIVSLVDPGKDEATFDDHRAIENTLYLVKAVILESTGANIKAAAKRIDALLADTTLEIEGYELMSISRESRVRYTEVDEVDKKIRWQHRGGRYRVQVTPTT